MNLAADCKDIFAGGDPIKKIIIGGKVVWRKRKYKISLYEVLNEYKNSPSFLDSGVNNIKLPINSIPFGSFDITIKNAKLLTQYFIFNLSLLTVDTFGGIRKAVLKGLILVDKVPVKSVYNDFFRTQLFETKDGLILRFSIKPEAIIPPPPPPKPPKPPIPGGDPIDPDLPSPETPEPEPIEPDTESSKQDSSNTGILYLKNSSLSINFAEYQNYLFLDWLKENDITIEFYEKNLFLSGE